MNSIQVGVSCEKIEVVTNLNTARNFGSGSLDVYATPAMIALMEGAAMLAIQKHLPSGQGSVGTKVDVEHISATPLGMKVAVRAEVIAISNKKITFNVVAFDERGMIGQGIHERFIIDNAKFIDKTNNK